MVKQKHEYCLKLMLFFHYWPGLTFKNFCHSLNHFILKHLEFYNLDYSSDLKMQSLSNRILHRYFHLHMSSLKTNPQSALYLKLF